MNYKFIILLRLFYIEFDIYDFSIDAYLNNKYHSVFMFPLEYVIEITPVIFVCPQDIV
jgi:hypothetical protein